MKQSTFCAVVLLLGIVLAACGGGSDNTKTFNLGTQNGSGESGTVTLTAMGDNQTKVMIDLKGVPSGAVQPAHIHDGACPNPGKVIYPLPSVKDGKSETVVNASLSSLTSGKFAVNIHKSPDHIKIYVACGDLK